MSVQKNVKPCAKIHGAVSNASIECTTERMLMLHLYYWCSNWTVQWCICSLWNLSYFSVAHMSIVMSNISMGFRQTRTKCCRSPYSIFSLERWAWVSKIWSYALGTLFHILHNARQPTIWPTIQPHSKWLFIIVSCHIFANKCFTIKWTNTSWKTCATFAAAVITVSIRTKWQVFFSHFTNSIALNYRIYTCLILFLPFFRCRRRLCMWFVGATIACGIGFVLLLLFVCVPFVFICGLFES